MNKPKVKAVAQIFLGIFILLAGVSLYQERQTDDMTRDWPHTTGKIIEIQPNALFHGKGVAYEYKVDGQVLQGSRVAHSDKFLPKYWGSDKRSEWINEKYTKDQEVQVYYNPDNTSDSALMVGVLSDDHDGSVVLIFLGVGIIGVGVYLLGKVT